MRKPSPPRVLGLDLARAGAIVGMVLINFQVFLLAPGAEQGPVARWLSHLPSGRASALFVTLAGAGVALMTHGADHRRARRTLLLRAGFLFVAGNLLILVWRIDILHHYAFYLAIGALLFGPLPRRWLPPVAVVIALLAVGLRLAFPDVTRPDADAYWTPLGMLQNNLGWGIHPVLPWIAFLVVGLWIGRHDLRDSSTRGRLAQLGALLAVGAHLVSAALEEVAPVSALRFLGTGWSPDPLYVAAASGTAIWLIAAAQAIAARWPRAWLVEALVALGQLSFTAYLLHALVGVGVPRWVFDLQDEMTWGATVALWVGFSSALVPLAWLWRRRFARGPAEWLMRKLSGPTPPRDAAPARARLTAPPRWPWALVAGGAAVVLALRFVGTSGTLGCPPSAPIRDVARGHLTLTCERETYSLVVARAADVTLETHSGHDVYLELYRGDELIAENDDAGEGLNARLTRTLAPGVYRVVVRPYSSALGAYALTRIDGPPTVERPGCLNSCASAFDDECDDGGEGALYDVCEPGTDCADCGPRDSGTVSP